MSERSLQSTARHHIWQFYNNYNSDLTKNVNAIITNTSNNLNTRKENLSMQIKHHSTDHPLTIEPQFNQWSNEQTIAWRAFQAQPAVAVAPEVSSAPAALKYQHQQHFPHYQTPSTTSTDNTITLSQLHLTSSNEKRNFSPGISLHPPPSSIPTLSGRQKSGSLTLCTWQSDCWGPASWP